MDFGKGILNPRNAAVVDGILEMGDAAFNVAEVATGLVKSQFPDREFTATGSVKNIPSPKTLIACGFHHAAQEWVSCELHGMSGIILSGTLQLIDITLVIY